MIITYEISLDYISITIEKNAIYFKSDFLFNINFAYLIHNIYTYKYKNNIPDNILKVIPDSDTTFHIINNINTSNFNGSGLFNIVVNYIKKNFDFVNNISLKPDLIKSSNNYKQFLEIMRLFHENEYLLPYYKELSSIHVAFLVNNKISKK